MAFPDLFRKNTNQLPALLTGAPHSLHLGTACRPEEGRQLCPEASPRGEDPPEKLSSKGAVSHLSTRKFYERAKVLPWETGGSSWLPGKSVASQLEGEALWKCFEVTAVHNAPFPKALNKRAAKPENLSPRQVDPLYSLGSWSVSPEHPHGWAGLIFRCRRTVLPVSHSWSVGSLVAHWAFSKGTTTTMLRSLLKNQREPSNKMP